MCDFSDYHHHHHHHCHVLPPSSLPMYTIPLSQWYIATPIAMLILEVEILVDKPNCMFKLPSITQNIPTYLWAIYFVWFEHIYIPNLCLLPN